LVRIGDQARYSIDEVVGQRTVTRVFEVKNVFQLIVNGLDDATFAQNKLVESRYDLWLYVLFDRGDQSTFSSTLKKLILTN